MAVKAGGKSSGNGNASAGGNGLASAMISEGSEGGKRRRAAGGKMSLKSERKTLTNKRLASTDLGAKGEREFERFKVERVDSKA